ncbi:MAG TPA: pseudouridine-5'-phosphate glycosidase [Blastocatellia bacterium]|nr:pseudouridine-5'-phosphate glycosidase [Blastocatellia bacterium]
MILNTMDDLQDNTWFRLAQSVSEALQQSQPIVCLESTVISHGLPRPLNLETALECEAAISRLEAVPATVGVIDGVPAIGLTREQIEQMATGKAPDGSRIEKVTLNNLSAVMATRRWGATTVAGSIRIATLGGSRYDEIPRPLVFSTGGIGGVHRGAEANLDISADLTALGSMQILCVAAGAKAVLDLPKTLEYLETLGVPVVGYQTNEFPAFYSRSSNLPVDVTVTSPTEAAAVAVTHWRTGGRGAVLVCVPLPREFDISVEDVEEMTGEAIKRAAEAGVRGKAVTPFLLSEMEKLSGGKTLAANRALLVNNARAAAEIACELKAFQG